MPVENIVQVPPNSTGQKVRTTEVVSGVNTVEMQVINVGDPTTVAALSAVANAQPAGTEYGLVVREAQKGQAIAASSRPVVIASDQSAVLTKPTDGTNPITKTFNLNTGVGADWQLGVDLRKATATGSVEAGTATDPLRVDPTGTTVQPVSGTVTSNQGAAPWTQRIQDGVGATLATVTAGNALKVDGSAVTQPVSGTVTANIGTSGALALDASVAGLSLTQGAATAGQKAALVEGAVTTAAPVYTTGNSNPLSLTTVGGLRVDGSGVTQPVSGTVTANAGTGTLATDPIDRAARLVGQVEGRAASGAAKAGNPSQIGGVFNTTQPTVLTGQAVEAQFTARGAQIVAAGVEALNVTVNAALPTGANVIGALSANQSVNVAQIAGTATGTAAAGIQKVGITGNAGTILDAATGTVVPANAIYRGGRGTTANPTAVADGQTVGAMHDKLGRTVVVQGHVRDLVGVQTTNIAVTTETTVVTAGAAGVFNDITSLVITNRTATAEFVTLKDATAGTTRAIYDLAANGGIVINFSPPLPQAVAANNWTITQSVANTIDVNIVFVKNT